MVEQRTLNPSVVVRIHLPQLRGRETGTLSFSLFLFEYFAYILRIDSIVHFCTYCVLYQDIKTKIINICNDLLVITTDSYKVWHNIRKLLRATINVLLIKN